MGTSSSSSGASSGVPLIPAWVPDLEAGEIQQDPSGSDPVNAEETGNGEGETSAAKVELAPRARFAAARRSAGQFSKSGDRSDLKRTLGHYSSTGLGGRRNAMRRFAGTAATAGRLYEVLRPPVPGREREAPTLTLDALRGRPAREILLAVADAVRPVDGTQDTEVSRRALIRAQTDLLEVDPDADILNLENEQLSLLVEAYIAYDVSGRALLDLGKRILEAVSGDSVAALERMQEVEDYVREVVAGCFRKLPAEGKALSRSEIERIASKTLADTFLVFEGALQ